MYGTLKKGHSNFNNYLTQSNFLSSGVTLEKYPFIIEGLPYVSSDEGNGFNVEVDVMLVDDDELFELDCLESHPNWYERKQVKIHTEDFGVVTAWLYFNDTVEYNGKELQSTYTEESKYSYNDWDSWNSRDEYIEDTTECCGECGSSKLGFDDYEAKKYCWECDAYTYGETYFKY